MYKDRAYDRLQNAYKEQISQLNTYNIQTILLSQPKHMLFQYTSSSRYIRILQLQKRSAQSNNDRYFYNTSQQTYLFLPKRCVTLDNCLATIQRKTNRQVISYDKASQNVFSKYIGNKIFDWFQTQQMKKCRLTFTKSYLAYKQLDNFCFGRIKWIRKINSIQLTSDNVSRDQCQLKVKQALNVNIHINKLKGILRINNPRRNQSNLINRVTIQLWQKVCSYLVSTKDRYYLIDSGSRNGTYIIELNNKKQQKKQQNNNSSLQIPSSIPLKQRFSYQFQGQQYIIKIRRQTKFQQKDITQHNMNIISFIKQHRQTDIYINNHQKAKKLHIVDTVILKKFFNQNQDNQHIWKMQFLQKLIKTYEYNLQKNKKENKQKIKNENQQKNKADSEYTDSQKDKKQDKKQKLQETDQIKAYLQYLASNRLCILILSLKFPNQSKKFYCIICQHNHPKKFYIGQNMTINTLNYDYYGQMNKCSGFIQFDGEKWSINSVKTQQYFTNRINIERNQIVRNLTDDDLSETQETLDTQIQREQKQYVTNKIIQNTKLFSFSTIPAKRQLKRPQKVVIFNLKQQLKHKIWIKVRSSQALQLNPLKKYIMRLAHGFYFELKFFNYDKSDQ